MNNLTMKAVVYLGPREVEVEEVDRPIPNKDEVLVQVYACGICGSDISIYKGSKGSTETKPPLILGHEFAGQVVEVGSHVKNIKVGDRVAIDPADNCHHCYYCRNGLIQHCENMGAIGTNRNGGFAEFAIVPERLVHKLGNHVPYTVGAMAEPLACCIHGIDRSGIKASDTVLIYGGGFIGLTLMQLAKMQGAAEIILVEPVEEKRKLAMRMGATLTIDPLQENVRNRLENNGIKHLQVIIETSGVQTNYEESIDLIDKYGRILFFAVTPPEQTMNVSTYRIYQKELTLLTSFTSPNTFARAVHLLNANAIDIESLLAGTKPLEEFESIVTNKEYLALGKWIITPNY